jgi:hypothetical protein
MAALRKGLKNVRKMLLLGTEEKITKSKHANGIAITVDSDGDDIIEAAKMASVDLNLGLPKAQLREKRIEREFMASAITFGQAVPGGLECHNFAEELSITTLSSNVSVACVSIRDQTY